MGYSFENSILSRFESLETLLRDEFRTVNNRLGMVEKQARITNGRVTSLENAGITEKAVKQALDEVHETNRSVSDRFWNNWSNRTQVVVGALTIGIVVFGWIVVIVDVLIHHHL